MNHSMWKKWRKFRLEALNEGDKDPTLEGVIAGMTGAAMNLIPTLTNMTKYIDFIIGSFGITLLYRKSINRNIYEFVE